MPPSLANRDSGFTLAELIVATSLMSIVLVGAYVALSGSLRMWRTGEDGFQACQDARVALTIMEHDLNNIARGSTHMMVGEDDTLTFVSLTTPMNVEEGEDPRLVQVTYRLGSAPRGGSLPLIREERVVEGPLPPAEDEDAIRRERLVLGTAYESVLTDRIRGFQIAYVWVPPTELPELTAEQVLDLSAFTPPAPIYLDGHSPGWGKPQGLRITLALADAASDTGTTTFASTIAFRGPTTPMAEGPGAAMQEDTW